MIKNLTKKQEERLVECRDEYLAYGLCTDPSDRPRAEAAVRKLAERLGDDPKKTPFLWFGSPMACTIAINLLDNKQARKKFQKENDLEGDLADMITKTDWVQKIVGEYVKNKMKERLAGEREKLNFEPFRFSGQLEAYWVATYLFASEIGVSQSDEDMDLLVHFWDELTKSTHVFWYNGIPKGEKTNYATGSTHDDICYMCDRPKAIHLKERRLHKDGGPCIEYRDGWGFWALNGVSVPQWLAETHPGQIAKDAFTRVDNAEVRRELVRKIGYEKILSDIGAETVDHQKMHIYNGAENFEHDYKLLRMPGNQWMFLSMLNPSISTPDNPIYHIEPVDNSCKTVADAIKFRMPDKFQSHPMAEDGSNWYQHGDVVLVPEGLARNAPLKPLPTVLA